MKLSDRELQLLAWCVDGMATMHEPEIEASSGFKLVELDRLAERLRTERQRPTKADATQGLVALLEAFIEEDALDRKDIARARAAIAKAKGDP